MSAVPATAAAAGTISGTVTDGATGDPVTGLEVCAFALPEDGNVSHCGTTNAAGEYTITDLLVHGYRVIFYGERLGYMYEVYREAELGYFGDAVDVSSEPITGIDIAMEPFGRIEGRVIEADTGAPAAEIRVCAWNERDEEELGNCEYTDGDGTYAISDVRPGEYAIEFLGTGNLLTQAWKDKEIGKISDATPVTVGLGQVLTGIDAKLVAGARVEGTVRLASDGQPAQGLYVCALRPNGEEWRCAIPNREGEYSIEGLKTGNYVIEFQPSSSALQTQFWDQGTSFADARTLSLTAGTTTTAIDADLFAPPAEVAEGPSPAEPEPVQTGPVDVAPTGTSPADTTPIGSEDAQESPASATTSTQPSIASTQPSPVAEATPPASMRVPRSCRRGFHKKRFDGEIRCVRKTKQGSRRRDQARSAR
jgi:5-hydroxyisourate hydrolase-like protein (transthyretin family)